MKRARIVSVAVVAGLVAAGLVASVAPPAAAAAIVVDDVVDGPPAAGDCTDATAGNCSIRDAFAAAIDPTGDTITLGVDVDYHLTLGSLQHNPNSPLTIQGNGATIDQDTAGHAVVGKIQNAFTLVDVVITGGTSGSFGGGVSNTIGSVTLVDSVVTGNTSAAFGGGVGAAGVALVRSTVSDNEVGSGSGGGIGVSNNGLVSIVDSTISGNRAPGGQGGGIYADGSVGVTITRSTIAGNTAQFAGGYRTHDSPTTITSSTFSGNGSPGIQTNGAVTIVGSTVVDNGDYNLFVTAKTVYGSVIAGAAVKNCFNSPNTTSLGSNYEQDTNTCGLGIADLHTAPATQLGPLQDNGGPTFTRIAPTGSPIINLIPNAQCDDGDVAAGMTLTVDQRGAPRPALVGGSCDAGAVDTPQPPAPPVDVVGTPGNGSATVSYTLPDNPGDSPIIDATVTCVPTGSGATIAATAPSPATVSPLVNGTPYSCTVAARNTQGTGPASVPVGVTPRTVPGAPVAVSASASGSGGALVRLLPPASNGGAAISSYTATCVASGKPTRTASAAAPTSTVMVTGLVNGTAYACRVVATNVAGVSPASNVTFVRAGVPSQPLAVSVSKGVTNGSLKVSWIRANQNAAPITTYVVVCAPASGASKALLDTASPANVTGLVRTKAYLCRVHARNRYGTGTPRYATQSVVPR